MDWRPSRRWQAASSIASLGTHSLTWTTETQTIPPAKTMRTKQTLLFASVFCIIGLSQFAGAKPSDPALAIFQPVKAPMPHGLALKPGDRLAICGDSITEQKM